MILTYRQKLRPTKAQHRLLDERLERQRLFYNAAKQERDDAHRLCRKSITRLDQQKSLTVIRADDPFGHGADPVTMGRWTLKRVDDAYAGFYGRPGPLCPERLDTHRLEAEGRRARHRLLGAYRVPSPAFRPPGRPVRFLTGRRKVRAGRKRCLRLR